MVLMLIAAGILYLLLGDSGEATMLMVAVVAVIGLTLSQSVRSQRALDALKDLSAPRSLVIRDGAEVRISSADLVVGDMMILHEGDRVPADAVLLHGQIQVDESLLTGESATQQKIPAGAGVSSPTEQSQLSSGTLVTQGVAWARVTATGVHSSLGKIGLSLRSVAEAQTPLQEESGHLVRRVAAFGLLIAIAVVLLAWLWDGRALLQSLLLGIATAMAILPEEIPVVLTVFLALGAWRLSKYSVLTRRLSAIETLGAITVLAVDKTGTLTHNRMRVASLSNLRATYTNSDGPLPEQFHVLTEFAALATPQGPFDPMEKALKEFAQSQLAQTEHEHLDWQPAHAYELSSDILAMTHAFAEGSSPRYLLATKGAPEAVADLCHLGTEELDGIRAEVEAMASRGLRVLGVARGAWSGSSWPASQHDFDFEFLGLVGLIDPPRQDVSAAIAECRSAGIRIVMLTGDHPATASAIAQQIGLTGDAVLTGPQLDGMSDEALQATLPQTFICARVKPHHKLRLVRALQAGGEVVAMTGDGVNDGPALRAANVGIAMGQRGTDVAREAASIVLLDDSFASIVHGIRQGRLIDRNLRKAIAFVFAVHVPVVLLALAPVAFHWPILLLPAQIVLLELLIDPACSVFFEAEPGAANLMNAPPRRASDSALGWGIVAAGLVRGALSAIVLVVGTDLLVNVGFGDAEVRTAIFLGLVVGVLIQLFGMRSTDAGESRNPWLWRILLLVTILIGSTTVLAPFGSVLGLASISLPVAYATLALTAGQSLAVRLANLVQASAKRRT